MKRSAKHILLCSVVALGALSVPDAAYAGFFDKKDKSPTVVETASKAPPAANALQGTRPLSFADLAENLLPTVVNISSTVKSPTTPDMEELMPNFPEGSPFGDFFERFMERHGRGMPSMPASSLGSGFIIDAEKGYIVTNNHVIKDADEVRVTLHNDETLEAEILGRDEKTDLAVLKINTKGHTLKAVDFGDSDAMRVGDWVLAIGNPFGLGGTVTSGIISARARDINSGPYDDFLQTDASINRGNSGGPMFNLDGQVIGINTAIFSPTGGSVGIGFAIPSQMAKNVVAQLVEYGHTRRGWLGVRIQTVTDEIAESLGLDEAKGALVASVTEGSPAEKAKFKAGDIILSFDGKPIAEMRELPRLVAATKIDAKVKVEILRDGKKQKLTVEIGELEKAEKEGLLEDNTEEPSDKGQEIQPLGLEISPVTDELRDEYGLTETAKGLLIVGTKPDGAAEQKGVMVGDVITEINQKPVHSVADVKSTIKEAKKNKRSSVLLLLNRGGDVRFVAVKLAEEPKK